MSKPSQSNLQLSAIKAIEGIRQNLSKMTAISLDGTTFTPTTLVAYFMTYVDLVNGLTAAHDQLHALVVEEGVARDRLTVMLRCLNGLVINLYGQDPVKVGEFGQALHKVGKETVATKAAAIAKNKATRLARHTMGPKARLAITGESPAPAPVAPASSTSVTTAPAAAVEATTNGIAHAKA